MLPQVPREVSQLISAATLLTGIILMTATPALIQGCALIGLSVWVMLISESILLGKVQTEMQNVLQKLQAKREHEVEELLYFLRYSKICSSPLESIESATRFMSQLPHPGVILGPALGIICANKKFTSVLGRPVGSLDGKPAHVINDNVVMSRVGELVNRPEHENSPAHSLRYVYKHADGSNIFGSLHVVKMDDGCFFMMFHPDADNIVNQEELESMLSC